MKRTLVLLALAAIFLCPVAFADEEADAPEMSIGSKAPSIDITHWVKGVEMDRRGSFTPVTDFQEGQVYVIEFWATWCGPCVASMPHLSALQAQYKDRGVTIIGVSDESLPKVTQFLFQTYKQDGKLQNDRVGYTLTTDPDMSVKRDYFSAAGQTGIPCSFIVGKQGLVEWIGHPGSMDDALESIVSDSWDRDAYKVKFDRDQAEKKLMREANGLLAPLIQQEDWDGAVTVLDGLVESLPDAVSPRYQAFMILLTMANRPAAAYERGSELLEKVWDKSGTLNQIAWLVVDDKRVKKRDLDFALKAAARANELAESKDPAILDTLARVHFEKGDLKTAIEWQEKAVERAGDNAMAAEIREALAKYKKALADTVEAPVID